MTNTSQVWGILNVTPDSFSDGGHFLATDVAVVRALEMVAQGANVIDVGGESTRPGATRISIEEECERVLPVVQALVSHGIVVSVDTMRAEVAKQAIQLGAAFINDVSGGKADADMYATVADAEVEYVVMHWRGHSDVMNSLNQYENVVDDVIAELQTTIAAAVEAGVSPSRIIIDPGLGFSKDAHHNWEIVQNIHRFTLLNHRVLVGASRKRFLAECVAPNATDLASERDDATAALSLHFAQQEVWAIRVHEIAANVAAIKVAQGLSA